MSPGAIAARLQKYEQIAGLGGRKCTMHSFRVGAALTRAIAGQDAAMVMASIGWKSRKKKAKRYMGSAVSQDGCRTRA